MDIGVSVSTDFGQLLDTALWAEEVGLTSLAAPDHVLRSQAVDPSLAASATAPSPFIQLAGVARHTARIGLAVMSSPVTFRHPAILLKSAIELSIVSSGRFTLGVGTGYRRSEHEVFGIPFPSSSDRWVALTEALGYLRAGIARPNPGFDGFKFRLAAHPISPEAENLRILVGGKGERRTPELAGRYADEYNLFLDEPDRLARRIEVAVANRERSEYSGSLCLSVAGVLITAKDNHQLSKVLAARADEVGMSPEAFSGLHSGPSSFLGTYEEVAQRLAQLKLLGIERCHFVFERAVDRKGVEAVLKLVA